MVDTPLRGARWHHAWLRPLFIRGRWEVHCVLSGVCTSIILLAQYLMISFRRGSIFFTREVWWQIGGPGLIAMLMAPLVFWRLHWLGVRRNTVSSGGGAIR